MIQHGTVSGSGMPMHSDGTSKLITPNLQVPTTKLVKCRTAYLTVERTSKKNSNPPRSRVPKEGAYRKLSTCNTYRTELQTQERKRKSIPISQSRAYPTLRSDTRGSKRPQILNATAGEADQIGAAPRDLVERNGCRDRMLVRVSEARSTHREGVDVVVVEAAAAVPPRHRRVLRRRGVVANRFARLAYCCRACLCFGFEYGKEKGGGSRSMTGGLGRWSSGPGHSKGQTGCIGRAVWVSRHFRN
jgi:hypothetical protein